MKKKKKMKLTASSTSTNIKTLAKEHPNLLSTEPVNREDMPADMQKLLLGVEEAPIIYRDLGKENYIADVASRYNNIADHIPRSQFASKHIKELDVEFIFPPLLKCQAPLSAQKRISIEYPERHIRLRLVREYADKFIVYKSAPSYISEDGRRFIGTKDIYGIPGSYDELVDFIYKSELRRVLKFEDAPTIPFGLLALLIRNSEIFDAILSSVELSGMPLQVIITKISKFNSLDKITKHQETRMLDVSMRRGADSKYYSLLPHNGRYECLHDRNDLIFVDRRAGSNHRSISRTELALMIDDATSARLSLKEESSSFNFKSATRLFGKSPLSSKPNSLFCVGSINDWKYFVSLQLNKQEGESKNE